MAITLRPSDKQLEQIEVLKKTLNINTSSKALFSATLLYPILKKELSEANIKIESLDRELNFDIKTRWPRPDLQEKMQSFWFSSAKAGTLFCNH